MYIGVMVGFQKMRFTDLVHKCGAQPYQSPATLPRGKGRYSQKEFVQFLYHARGSLLELETQLSIARDLEYIDLAAFKSLESQTEELGRILNGLINPFLNSSRRAY